jgi:Zn-dependent M28 family amino/carboxypeptidase
MTNIIGRFGNLGKPGVLLCAHWDTRPTADMDSDLIKRKKPIIGANDGASGVAVLLELAHMFRKTPPAVPVTIVFFDGEDWGPGSDDMFLGARYYASRIGSNQKFKYGILLDMVGDSSLNIPREANSQRRAEFVVDKVWKAATDLGYSSSFTNSVKYNISDDHLPLLQAGISCIDVIDFDYPYWHTLADTPDKCSPSSLKIVGETVARVVYSEQL